LLIEKLNFNNRVSEVQQRYETTQERLDLKSQRCKELKQELSRIKEEGFDRDLGTARLREELALVTQQKGDAETKLSKFEPKYRQALREVEELREKLESKPPSVLIVDEDMSISTSFVGF
jgi:chromosome segregation ATPase